MGGRCCCADGGAQVVAPVGRQTKLRMGRLQNSGGLPNVEEQRKFWGVKREIGGRR